MINTLHELREKYQRPILDTDVSQFDVIYHYTTPNALLKILTQRELWFSDIEYLNDESETSHTYRMLQELLFELKDSIISDFNTGIHNEINNVLNDIEPETLWKYVHKRNFFVASFSNDRDNLPLWSYYTKNSNMAGYNIGFNKKIIHKISHLILGKSFFFTYGNIIYDEQQQKEILKNALLDYNEVFRNCEKKDEKNIIESFKGLLIIFSLFFKKECFKVENEYRIVIDNPTDPLMKEDCAYENKFREQKGYFVPYITSSFEPDDIESISISPTIGKDYYEKGTKRMLLNFNYHKAHQNVAKSNIPLRY